MEVDYINGSKIKKIYGMSRYEKEINQRINNITFNRIEFAPLMARMEGTYQQLSNPQPAPPSNTTRILHPLMDVGWDVVSRMDRYRYQRMVKKMINPDNIKHITFQDLGYILKSVKMEKTIINCHDLIPWAYDQDRTSLWRNNMEGMKRADEIITVSNFSKQEIVKHLEFPEERVHVIPDAVDQESFHPPTENSLKERMGLDPHYKYILYVGSETPRMNLKIVLEAVSRLKKLLPSVKLLKIGEPQSYLGRKNTGEEIRKHNLEKDIIFLGYVPEEDLPLWYGLSDVLVYPCLYAGFGLPPLEAMACGTPVITSNTSSLPEVVGGAALLMDPHKPQELMVKLYEILTMDTLRDKMISKGLKQAKKFSWADSAKKTEEVYHQLL